MRLAFGIDIGGTGIKVACVDLDAGHLVGPRHVIGTPAGARPSDVAAAVAQVIGDCGCCRATRIGVTVPAVVDAAGRVRTAANIDPSWIGVDVVSLLSEATGRAVVVLNDADAVGLVEARIGAAAGQPGVVVVVTLGTGIGTAVLIDGVLMPNTELGHLVVEGHNACFWACSVAREREQLTWEEWSARLQAYLRYLEDLLWPGLIVIGGGVSAASKRFFPLLSTRTPLVAASRFNDGGIVGAALAAADALTEVAPCPVRISCRQDLAAELIVNGNGQGMPCT